MRVITDRLERALSGQMLEDEGRTVHYFLSCFSVNLSSHYTQIIQSLFV